MGPRETARYGFRIGEASHPGPPDDSGGDMSRLQDAAAVTERVARIDELVTGMRAEFQILQAERFTLVGAYTYAGWSDGNRAAWPTLDGPAFSDPLLVVLRLGWCPSLFGWRWDEPRDQPYDHF